MKASGVHCSWLVERSVPKCTPYLINSLANWKCTRDAAMQRKTCPSCCLLPTNTAYNDIQHRKYTIVSKYTNRRNSFWQDQNCKDWKPTNKRDIHNSIQVEENSAEAPKLVGSNMQHRHGKKPVFFQISHYHEVSVHQTCSGRNCANWFDCNRSCFKTREFRQTSFNPPKRGLLPPSPESAIFTVQEVHRLENMASFDLTIFCGKPPDTSSLQDYWSFQLKWDHTNQQKHQTSLKPGVMLGGKLYHPTSFKILWIFVARFPSKQKRIS